MVVATMLSSIGARARARLGLVLDYMRNYPQKQSEQRVEFEGQMLLGR